MDRTLAPADIYGALTFTGDVMLKRLPADVFSKLQKTIKQGLPLEASIANTVALAMKDWAMEHGATHYCHWFQPLTGMTAATRTRPAATPRGTRRARPSS